MAVTAARRIAFEVLRRVETGGAYAADLLHARLHPRAKPDAALKRQDAALATELTLGVLRWQRWLDFLIEQQTGKPTVRLDLEVRLALRLGLYQLRFLTRVPPRAAVHESVELVKWVRKRSAAPLVNVVLRRATEAATLPAEQLIPAALPEAERLGIRFSHPTWLVERWLRRFGPQKTAAVLETNNHPPRLSCAVSESAPREEIVSALEAAGLRVEPGRWLRSALAVSGGDPADTDPFRRGHISIQDEASQMVPLLLEVQTGHSVLDLCAAPGGKTHPLACAAGSRALVVAADRHAHRLRAMWAHLERLGPRNVRLVALDATRPLPLAARFDRILVDAPCSGTGTLARNPEIRWRLRAEDLSQLHARQVALLTNALEHLAPGGRVVYATCSFEPEENEQVIETVLRNRDDLRSVPAVRSLAGHLASGILAGDFFQQGYFRTWPPEHQTDGFFAAILERRA